MQLTVVQKMIAGFVLFGVLLLITNVLSYLGLSQIRASAESVIEQKMPVQSQMQQVQTRILSAGQVSLQGFYSPNLEQLTLSQQAFSDMAAILREELTQLQALNASGQDKQQQQQAIKAAKSYLDSAESMYAQRKQYLTLQQTLREQFQTLDFAGADTGAYLLDISYLRGAEEEPLRSVAGVGGKVDTLILTLTQATEDYIKATDSDDSQSIRQNVEMAMGDVDNNVNYMNTIARGVDTDGLLEAFNEEYQKFVELYTGSGGLFDTQQAKLQAKQQMDSAMASAQQSLSEAQTRLSELFDKVNAETRQGQTAILDEVQSNIIKGVAIMLIAIGLVAVIGTLLARSISKPLNQVRNSLAIIRRGDLTHKAETSSEDEFASLARDVNAVSDSLHEVVSQIIGQEVKLERAVDTSRQLADETLNHVAEQTDQLRDTAHNTEQVREASQTNLEQIQHSSERLADSKGKMTKASDMVSRGQQQIRAQAEQASQSASVIHRLEENTANISGILDVIRNIADQTNLLALNAAIEAARAGEQGRGFAVVADEVRTLASRTQESTQEINDMITSLQSDAQQAVQAITDGQTQADESVALIESVNQEILTVQEVISELADINQQVVDKTGYQDQLLQSVADSINRIVELAEQSAQSTQESNQSIQDITGLMAELHQVVKRFKLKG
ncbi:Methyl-accepting chemotaxis protein McpB [Saliniradius amylolyticus]|uniref:Methyl-accepting chemotaxis protein McpB n=1 Tax=Saliniradius amylolyticus TaxID=2183582 RepID=A0A2S2E3A5_9ALTE|nr:HAMP domain-containing methyl-accepting chemotaxis protein [Saliniradius amylolyticus]AWL12135.1 Methyl-accepting chemotaxis protein McpB [Saliniradius amylolyticus]